MVRVQYHNMIIGKHYYTTMFKTACFKLVRKEETRMLFELIYSQNVFYCHISNELYPFSINNYWWYDNHLYFKYGK
jgi:hypothetical protein